jgi:hypothetical protein
VRRHATSSKIFLTCAGPSMRRGLHGTQGLPIASSGHPLTRELNGSRNTRPHCQ